MAEEKEAIILKAILWLQKQQEALAEEGFMVVFRGNEYLFFPKYFDRNDKKMDRLLSGKTVHYSENWTNCLNIVYLKTILRVVVIST